MIEENKLAYRDLRMNASKVVITEAPGMEVVRREVQPSDLQLEEIKQKVRALYAEALDIDTADAIGDDQHFIDDLDGDSLQVLSAALKTEEQFSITIPVEEYGQCTTVNDMSALIYAKLNGQTAYENQGSRTKRYSPLSGFEDAPEFIAFQKRIDSLDELGGVKPILRLPRIPAARRKHDGRARSAELRLVQLCGHERQAGGDPGRQGRHRQVRHQRQRQPPAGR